MDFFRICEQETKKGQLELYPDFHVRESDDLMIRGGKFYAVWNEGTGLWSTHPFDVVRIVDDALLQVAQEKGAIARWMSSSRSRSWKEFIQWASMEPDHWCQLNRKIVFSNSPVQKADYASHKLPYALGPGDIAAWEELVSRLYAPEERSKIEWAIGSIVMGDSKWIQKFLVFYGPPATGKSTILNIIGQLFEGYCVSFDGKALGSSNGTFATSAFKDNPLVAIQHDSDLSRLEDNTRFNSIIAHEPMEINEKYKPSRSGTVEAMLFLGSNVPVKIPDAKSGMVRRLIDVNPTGVTFPPQQYYALMDQIRHQLGAIAYHCAEIYRQMGPDYYAGYRPVEMILQTNIFYNFIEAYFDVFKSQNQTTLTQAFKLYKEWCDETGISKPLPMYKMREEMRNYFVSFYDRSYVDGKQVRSVYEGFTGDKFKAPKANNGAFTLVLEETESLLDRALGNQPAQRAKPDGTPEKAWRYVTTKLSDLDTGELHFVKVPPGHIVVDFDLEDLEKNLESASHWPSTYAEISKSGAGIHLHYIYDGDISKLASSYADGIEIKTLSGDASLRRRLSRCNAVPVSTISSGLPLKKEKMHKSKTITSEQGLRELIHRNLRKEIHPGTKPSIDFIKKILDDAYESGMQYDVNDLRTKILAFANNSTNQSALSVKVVRDMKWNSENPEGEIPGDVSVTVSDDRIVFFDVEVYPNLFVVCWKFHGADAVTRMVNPNVHEIEPLFKLKLVGFYNRRFDNHILYAASMGASNLDLFKLTQKIIEGNRNATFAAAYNLSYADIYDFSSEKASLKKFEIKLGILHMELDLPWDEPVDEKDWDRVVEYCENDVRATEAVFEDRKGDFIARQILAELSGLTVNDTTQNHTARIIFGDDLKVAHKKFVYTDLSKDFPGYIFEMGKSSYKDEDPGEGGYVYAEPGIYEDVAVLDVASMHPASIIELNLFGPYTRRFAELKAARVAIKRQEYETARKLLGDRIGTLLDAAETDSATSEALSYALKIVINTVYGLTSAKFENPFRDLRNRDNIVAKRGALFMIDLKRTLQGSGYTVAHIKTDSVKIPHADPQCIADVKTLGSFYGYEFEHEETYRKFCLVNDAVYIARLEDGTWKAVGAQFQHPYVFKTLFSREQITFDDLCEARSVVKGAMYMGKEKDEEDPDYRRMRHLGRTGRFLPVLEGGGVLWRVADDKYYAVSGTKGHRWMEAHIAVALDDVKVDYGYFDNLVKEATETIEKFGSFEEFVN